MWNEHYKYLKTLIKANGQMCDPFLKSPLNFQYHYAAFVLSSVLMDDFHGDGEKVLNYLLSIPREAALTSSEFNNFFLLNALIFDKKGELNPYRKEIKNFITHREDSELEQLNYNFRFLRYLNILLENQLERTPPSDRISIEKEWIIHKQFNDGFFPDSQISADSQRENGIPHLVYNAKILMTLSYAWYLTADEKLGNVFFKGLNSLLQIGGKRLNYGRSTNSIFGYSSLLFALKIASFTANHPVYKNWIKQIEEIFQNVKQPDGHLLINLNQEEIKRPGYDSYMYSIVYNCYSNALNLLNEALIKEVLPPSVIKNNIGNITVTTKPLIYFRDSGFILYSGEKSSYLLNIRGHQDSDKHKFDPRVSPFSLINWQIKEKEILPGMGYFPQPIHFQVEKKFYLRSILSILFKIRRYRWLPALSGNNFFYTRNGTTYYPYKPIKIIRLKNEIFCKFSAVSRPLFSHKGKKDLFVIHLIPDEGKIGISIYWYKAVDTVYYTFRKRENHNRLTYELDKPFRILPNLVLLSSDGNIVLERIKIKNIKRLKINIAEK